MNSIFNGSFVFFIMTFLIVSWMVLANVKPFILLEERTGQWVERHFGRPEMTYNQGFLTGLFTFLVTYGSAFYLSLATLMIAFFLILQGEFLPAFIFIAIVSSGGIFGIFLKNFFKRPRPKNSLNFEKGYSFPSGHAIATSLFFYSMIQLLLPMLANDSLQFLLEGLLMIIWMTTIFSRLYFHAHHLGDLIVGVSFAVSWVRIGLGVYEVLRLLI